MTGGSNITLETSVSLDSDFEDLRAIHGQDTSIVTGNTGTVNEYNQSVSLCRSGSDSNKHHSVVCKT